MMGRILTSAILAVVLVGCGSDEESGLSAVRQPLNGTADFPQGHNCTPTQVNRITVANDMAFDALQDATYNACVLDALPDEIKG